MTQTDSTPTREELQERFRLYRLCECAECDGRGKQPWYGHPEKIASARCPHCRGEGRTRDLVATCESPEAVGVALVTLAREGEFEDCPLGVLDTLGEVGQKWLIRPWLPSPRNVSDAGRTLARAKRGERP